ncbi:sulfotransferase [Colwellia marinimaniae]|uniref:sulfotransferase n=1 Tax=Colwellia TaxID=28228 RepID=UPI00070CC42D
MTEETGFLFPALNTYFKNQLENVGHSYLKQIGQMNKDSVYLSDKLPFNMLLIALIKIALPNVKTIHCVRESRDNCLSIFKGNFTTDNYRFAYNLKILGQFHNLYHRLMMYFLILFM